MSSSTAAVSPVLTDGGGLKHVQRSAGRLRRRVSPVLTDGGGLKHQVIPAIVKVAVFPPSSPTGAD